MSMHLVENRMLRSFRKAVGLSKRDMADIIFGGAAPSSIIENLEKGDQRKNKKWRQYRVTEHTANVMYNSMEVIFENATFGAGSRSQGGRG